MNWEGSTHWVGDGDAELDDEAADRFPELEPVVSVEGVPISLTVGGEEVCSAERDWFSMDDVGGG